MKVGDTKFKEEDILEILLRHGATFSSVAHKQIAHEINTLGFETAKQLAESYSPSQLGKMGYLGLRRLAQLKRDDPEKFKKVMEDLEKLLNISIYCRNYPSLKDVTQGPKTPVILVPAPHLICNRCRLIMFAEVS